MSTDAATAAATPGGDAVVPADPTHWILLNDVAGSHATILNRATRAIQTITAASIVGGGLLGLRRTVLTEQANGKYAETGEQVPLTPELLDDLVDAYHSPNSWNYDWPNWAVEGEATAAQRAAVKAALEGMMAKHPYEFEVIGLQRRFLLYYSDGDWRSQAKYLALAPAPDRYPYRLSDGGLRRRYLGDYTSLMRDAGRPFPEDWQRICGGSLRPLLYRGPAWVVRFRLDGQDVAFGHCRVYVTDDAQFICSDWCQRDALSRYEGGDGISLQTEQYTFDGWVVGPAIKNATQKGVFKPKSVTVSSDRVKDLLRKEPRPVTEFGVALDRAKTALQAKAAGQAPGTAAPGYQLRVVQAFDHNPHRSDLDVAYAVADAVLDDLKQRATKGWGAYTSLNGSLFGLPVDVPATEVPSAHREKLAPHKVAADAGGAKGTTFRLRVDPKPCPAAGDVTHYAQGAWVCVRDHGAGENFHLHLHPGHFTLDRDAVADAVYPAVNDERTRRFVIPAAVADVAPISPDALAEARGIMDALIDTRRTLRKADLISKAITAATPFLTAPVQQVFEHEGWWFRFIEDREDGTALAEYRVGHAGAFAKLGRVKRGKSGHVYVMPPGHDEYYRFDPGRQKDATLRYYKEFAGTRPAPAQAAEVEAVPATAEEAFAF